jgi:hypothetical protein
MTTLAFLHVAAFRAAVTVLLIKVEKTDFIGARGSIYSFVVLSAVIVLLLQVETSIFSWCMLHLYS